MTPVSSVSFVSPLSYRNSYPHVVNTINKNTSMLFKETNEMYMNIPSPMFETIISVPTIKTGIKKWDWTKQQGKQKLFKW